MTSNASVFTRVAVATTMVALAAATSGCSLAPRTPAAAASTVVKPEYSALGTLQKLQSDRDGDGTDDTFGYMDGARVIRVDVDENNDGTIDRWEYHTQGAGVPGAHGATESPEKTIERIERATKRDGKVNRKEFFEGGQLMRAEEDADGDGALDKWESYTGGTLTLMAVDTSHRGTPDRRIVYGPDGTFLRVEADTKGTGAFTPLTQ